MLAAYLDASGHHHTGRFLVVAGFIAKIEQWIEFEKAWKQFISSKPYELEYAHAKKISRWPNEKRKGFYLRANRLLKDHTWLAIAATIKHSDYKAAFRNYPLTQKDSHYGLTFRGTMVAICKHVSESWPGESVALILEHGDPNQGGAKHIFDITKAGSIYDEIKNDYPIDRLTIANKRDFGALQVADLHAHTKWQHHQVQAKTVNGDYRGDINYLLSDLNVSHFEIDKDLIREQRALRVLQEQARKNFGERKTKSTSGKTS